MEENDGRVSGPVRADEVRELAEKSRQLAAASSEPPEMPAHLTALMRPGPAPYGILDQMDVFDICREIRDPEHPQYTLGDLGVVTPLDIRAVVDFENVVERGDRRSEIWIEMSFRPTVAHCSLATTIGLCLFEQLRLAIPRDSIKARIDIPGEYLNDAAEGFIVTGAQLLGVGARVLCCLVVFSRIFCRLTCSLVSPLTEISPVLPSLSAVSKQINDKERCAAAMENPTMADLVRRCCSDPSTEG
jgi:hypothetical protein